MLVSCHICLFVRWLAGHDLPRRERSIDFKQYFLDEDDVDLSASVSGPVCGRGLDKRLEC